MTVRTPLCDLLGIEHPIVGFSPSEHVAAAVSIPVLADLVRETRETLDRLGGVR